MWTLRPAGPLLGCSAPRWSRAAAEAGKATPLDPDARERAAAEAVVARLGTAVRDADPGAGCQALTRASQRVVALVGAPGATCRTGLDELLTAYGLLRALPEAKELRATVTGARAEVRGTGLPQPITTARGADGWRVSLVPLPGLRADVTAARACGRYLTKADALTLPPFTPDALTARLRAEARLVNGFRGRLAGLPPDGPARLGLTEVTGALGSVRAELRAAADRVEAGGAVARGMQASARADRLVRQLLDEDAAKARIACPRDVTSGPELARRRAILDRACDQYSGVLDRLDADPGSPEAARANLRRVDRALARLDESIRRAPVAPRLRRLRAESRRAITAMRAAAASLVVGGADPSFDAAADRVEGYGAQIDAALIRLGATCLDSRRIPRSTPSPRRRSPTPRGALPPGTIEA